MVLIMDCLQVRRKNDQHRINHLAMNLALFWKRMHYKKAWEI